jgi:DNA-binding CsgD family transcriptional regulator
MATPTVRSTRLRTGTLPPWFPQPTPHPALPAALHDALELFPDAVALLDPAGSFLAGNTCFEQLLRAAGDPLHAAVCEFARSVAGGGGSPAERRVAGGRFRLRGRCVESGRVGPVRAVFVVVGAYEPEPLSDAELRTRYGLTRKEVRVARLLADGHSNAGVAAAFCISPHTARHHTGSVLAKLGASSRAQVGALLRRSLPAEN